MTYRHITSFVIFLTFFSFNVLFFSVSSAEEVYSENIHINEFLPDPDGDDATLEFIELANNSDADVDISHWTLDDIESSGSSVFTIPIGTILPANGFLAFYRPQTKITLNNDTDRVRLIRPDAVVQNDILYTSTKSGTSYNRVDADAYQESSTPTPGAANMLDPTPTVTPTPTFTPTPSPVIYSTAIHVSEFLPNPEGDDGELEFVELHNNSDTEADISGWVIDTGTTSKFTIDSGTILLPNAYVVFFSSVHDISLSNSSDHIQLIRPDGIVQDDVSYTTTKEGHSYNRLDSGIYDQSFTPTPNAVNIITASPTPTPKSTPTDSPKPEEEHVVYDFSPLLVINELLPNPEGPDEEYEFIEIKNLDKKTVRLAGWTLDDAAKGSGFHFTDERINAGKILVFERKNTKIALNNDTDTVKLIDPTGKIVSAVVYNKVVPEGQSWNRTVDGVYVWSETPTPGKENTIVVLKKVSPSPTPKKVKVVTTKKKATPTVLAARDEKLSWTETVSRTVVSPINQQSPATGKQRLFVLFGATAAFAQLASGISRKERIWRR